MRSRSNPAGAPFLFAQTKRGCPRTRQHKLPDSSAGCGPREIGPPSQRRAMLDSPPTSLTLAQTRAASPRRSVRPRSGGGVRPRRQEPAGRCRQERAGAGNAPRVSCLRAQGVWWHGTLSGGARRASPTCAGVGEWPGRWARGLRRVSNVYRGWRHHAARPTPEHARLPRAQGSGAAAPASANRPGVSPACVGVGAARGPWRVAQEGAPRGHRGPSRPRVRGAAGPNKGLQATANSLRSCLAAALGGA